MENKLQEIMNKMNEIQYGYKDIYPDNDEDWDNSFQNYYRLQSPSELLETKFGVCWDQVELERYYFKQNNINCMSYFIVEYDGKECPTHTFMVVNDQNKYFWFEHSWEPYRGIHEYNNLNLLLLDVKGKFNKMLEKRNISTEEVIIYEYSEPTSGLNPLEFFNHCEQGKKIKI